jgi:hypothetical protein
MKHDFDVLGEHPVYPGHAVTLALALLRLYGDRIDEASAIGRSGYSNAEAGVHYHVSGAGGHCTLALDLIRDVRDGTPVDMAFASADDDWAHTDDQAQGGYGKTEEQRARYIARWREGQEQADRFKPALVEAMNALTAPKPAA